MKYRLRPDNGRIIQMSIRDGWEDDCCLRSQSEAVVFLARYLIQGGVVEELTKPMVIEARDKLPTKGWRRNRDLEVLQAALVRLCD